MFGEIIVYPLASIGRLEQELVLVDKLRLQIVTSLSLPLSSSGENLKRQ